MRLIGLVIAAGVAWSSAALACSTCTCGDPTLTVMGTGKPFQGRTRASLGVSHRTEEVGRAGEDRRLVNEQRLRLGAAYTATEWLTLSLTTPLVRRSLESADLSRVTTTHLGDVELAGRAYVWRDRGWSPRHLVGLTAGLRTPTGPQVERAGAAVDPDAQPGSGLWMPGAGVFYGWYAHPWSVVTTASVNVPFEDRFGFQPGVAVPHGVRGQWQPLNDLALALGADGRWSARDHEGETVEADSGGYLLYASAGAVYSPATDLLVSATVRLPALDRLNGAHDEGALLELGVTHDF